MKSFCICKLHRLALVALPLTFGLCLSARAQHIWNAGSGTTNGWSEPLNWNFGVAPTSADAVLFNNDAPPASTNVQGAVNNVVDVSTSVASISFTAVTNTGIINGAPSTNFHTTMIPPGITLSVVGSGTLLNVGTGTDVGQEAKLFATITGGGNLEVGNLASPVATDSIFIGQGAGSSDEHRAYLDLSGLDSFKASVGTILMGDSATGVARKAGTLTLAKTNVLRVSSSDSLGAFRLCHNTGGQGRVSELLLGQTNAIFTDYMRVAGIRGGGANVLFQSGLSSPTVYLRGHSNPRMAQLNVAEGRGQTGANGCNASFDTTGGTLDCMVSTMILGYAPNSTSAASVFTGILTMDTGILDVSLLYIGWQGQNNVAPGVGIMNLNGTAEVLAGTLTIGRDAGNAAGFGTGTLNLAGNAKMTVTGNVLENNASGGNGSSTINFTNGGTMLVAGTMRVDNLNITNGNLALGIGPTINDANPACVVANLNCATAVTLGIQGSGYGLGRYPLIKYTGTIGGDGYGAIALSLPPRTYGYLSNNVANLSIDVVITNIAYARWEGNVNGDWDTNTANWIDSGTSLATLYSQATIPADSAIFDDNATGTRIVNLTTNLTPANVLITNSTPPYVFSGSGRLTGTMALSKNGSGTLVLTNSGNNSFVGGVNVNAGTLQLGLAPDRLPTSSLVTFADVPGAQLDLGGQDQTVGTLAGGGANGGDIHLGANTLTVENGGTYSGDISGVGGVLRKTVSGNLTLSGANTHSGGTILTGGALTLNNSSGSGVGNGPVDIATGLFLNIGNGGAGGSISGATFITNNGVMFFSSSTPNVVNASIEGSGNVVLGSTNTLLTNHVTFTAANTYTGYTSITNGALRISHSDALGDLNGQTGMSIYSPSARLELMGNINVAETIDPSQKSFGYGDAPNIVNVSDTNTLSGTLNLYQGGTYWSFRSDAGRLIVNGIVNNFTTSGSGRTLRLYGPADGEWNTPMSAAAGSVTHVLKHGTGTWTLTGTHSYNGTTLAYGGNLIVNGDILSTDNVEVGWTNFTHPYVPGGVPATFGGNVVIYGSVIVNTNGTLKPGNSIGTMSISNALTTEGTIVMDVNTDTLEHDFIIAAAGITYGGTLAINPSGLGTAVTNGASAKLFDAASYSGAFAAIVPATPGPGLAWNTSSLTVDGTLKIGLPPNTTPTNLTFAVTGGGSTLDISWPASHIGWRLEAQTNSVSVGISNNWFTVPGSAATNYVVMPIDAANGAVFYRMIYP